MKAGGSLRNRSELNGIHQLGSSAQDESGDDGALKNGSLSDTTVTVPTASSRPAPTTIAVFAFVHAIIFNTPLTRVKVEALAAAPLASATVVTDFASATGAA